MFTHKCATRQTFINCIDQKITMEKGGGKSAEGLRASIYVPVLDLSVHSTNGSHTFPTPSTMPKKFKMRSPEVDTSCLPIHCPSELIPFSILSVWHVIETSKEAKTQHRKPEQSKLFRVAHTSWQMFLVVCSVHTWSGLNNGYPTMDA